jgi:hypothetical protein
MRRIVADFRKFRVCRRLPRINYSHRRVKPAWERRESLQPVETVRKLQQIQPAARGAKIVRQTETTPGGNYKGGSLSEALASTPLAAKGISLPECPF